MNLILFVSSVILGWYNVWLLYNIQPSIEKCGFVVSGVTLSILNHGTTSTHLKYMDRWFMIVSAVILFCFSSNQFWISSAVTSYCIAKQFVQTNKIISDSAHVASHIFATIALWHFIL
jgi:hypothetical protein